jgi:hypothetical protein
MDAGISSPGNHQPNCVDPEDGGECPLDLALNGALARLNRPAREVGAVVLEVQAGR